MENLIYRHVVLMAVIDRFGFCEFHLGIVDELSQSFSLSTH